MTRRYLFGVLAALLAGRSLNQSCAVIDELHAHADRTLTSAFAADFDAFIESLKGASVQLAAFDRATKAATDGLKREIESISRARAGIVR